MTKRCFDIVTSLTGLILATPAFVVISLLIRLLDGPPVLFWQHRVGQGGKRFTLYKFRTMRSVPPSGRHTFEAGNVTRVTRLGKVLRKSKLDELPQLWNVVCGDMSLVGPRPEVERWVREYPERWARVHQIRPGITDPASIAFRNEEDLLQRAAEPEAFYREALLPRKLAIYEQYVNQRSFWGDLCILMQTLCALISRHDPQRIDGVGR